MKVKIEVGKILSSVVAITLAWAVAGKILIALTEVTGEILIIILLGAIASWLWYFFTTLSIEE